MAFPIYTSPPVGIDQSGVPYSQYAAAYKQVYGQDPPLDPGQKAYYAQNPNAIYTQQFSEAQGQIPLSTLMAIAGNKGAGTTSTDATSAAAAPAVSSSYFGGSPTITSGGDSSASGGGTSMANSNFILPSGQALDPSQTQQIMDLYQAYENGNAAAGKALVQWTQGMGISTSQLNTSVANLRSGTGANASSEAADPAAANQPETNALAQMAQIDPTSEALRQQLGQSYLTPLQQATNPSAAQFQSYLDIYKQIDPQGYAQRQAMGQQVSDYVTQVTGQAPTSPEDALAKYAKLDPQGYANMTALGGAMGQSLAQAQQEYGLGSTLDADTAREVEQQTRMGQSARGNIYGTPQLFEEAMARGTAGEARRQQRLTNLTGAQQGMQSYLTSGAAPGQFGNTLYGQGLAQRNAALGLQQGWLGSGQDIGSLGMNLYNQGQNNLMAQQQAALGYLGSGQTPYQAGASYLNTAENRAATAAQGGPQYNPASLGQSYGASQFSQYGLDVGSQAQNYYNSLSAYGGGATGNTKNQTASALTGAASGAASGALAGSAAGPYGTVIGGVAGAVGGGLSGYYS